MARAAIVLGGIDYAPVRLAGVERALAGKKLDDEAIAFATSEASRVESKTDVYASAAYRQRLAGVLVARALRKAIGQADPPA